MNSAKTPTGKASKGAVGLENLSGRIRLNFPRQWFNDKQKRVSLGLAWTPENIAYAESIASQMQFDYLAGIFDPTLDKYNLPGRKQQQQQNNVVDMPNKKPEMELLELWDKYCEHKRPNLRFPTYKLAYCGTYRNYLKYALETVENDAATISGWLIENKGKRDVLRTLTEVSKAHNWGIKQGFVTANPYEDLVVEMKKSKVINKGKKRDADGYVLDDSDIKDDVRAFSLDEANAIIEAYSNGKRNSHFTPLVKFLFWTGCRSGEACALRWQHIKQDCTVITFGDSYRTATKTTGDTKTYVDRIFRIAVGSKLHTLLKELESKRLEPSNIKELVFKTRTGKQTNWNTFSATWRGDKTNTSVIHKLIEQGKVKQYLSPYHTRHTFITHQVNNGIPAHAIAGMCGNSPNVIWECYFDNNHKDVIPVDF